MEGERRTISVLLFNIRSLRSNFYDFLAKMVSASLTLTIIVLTELWIYSHETSAYGIDGYNSYYCCQDGGRAGGVAIFVDESL